MLSSILYHSWPCIFCFDKIALPIYSGHTKMVLGVGGLANQMALLWPITEPYGQPQSLWPPQSPDSYANIERKILLRPLITKMFCPVFAVFLSCLSCFPCCIIHILFIYVILHVIYYIAYTVCWREKLKKLKTRKKIKKLKKKLNGPVLWALAFIFTEITKIKL